MRLHNTDYTVPRSFSQAGKIVAVEARSPARRHPPRQGACGVHGKQVGVSAGAELVWDRVPAVGSKLPLHEWIADRLLQRNSDSDEARLVLGTIPAFAPAPRRHVRLGCTPSLCSPCYPGWAKMGEPSLHLPHAA